MSQIPYPTHPNPAVQEEIDRKVTADVFAVLANQAYWASNLASMEPLRGKGGVAHFDANLSKRWTDAESHAREMGTRLSVALAVANAAEKRTLPTDDDLDDVELGPACSVSGEACESCQ